MPRAPTLLDHYSDPLLSFMREHCEREPSHTCVKRAFYQRLLLWWAHALPHRAPPTEAVVGRAMVAMGFKSYRVQEGAERTSQWYGISLTY